MIKTSIFNTILGIFALFCGYVLSVGHGNDVTTSIFFLVVAFIATLFVNRKLISEILNKKTSPKRLLELKALYDAGLLTKDEFDSKSEKLKKYI